MSEIIFNARDICLSLGVYAQKGVDGLIRRKVRENLGLEFSDFKESAASEYSHNFKPLAIADFEMSTGVDLVESPYFINENVAIRADGISNDTICMFFCEYAKKDIEELPAAKLTQKIYIYCQYVMYAARKKECHCVQWNSKASKVELIKYNPFFIERTLPTIQERIRFIVDSIRTDSERHSVDIDNSQRALNLSESYRKGKLELELILEKIDRIESNIVSHSQAVEKQNIGGLLVKKTDGGFIVL